MSSMELNFDTASSSPTTTTSAASSCPLLAQQLQMHFQSHQTEQLQQLLEPIMVNATTITSSSSPNLIESQIIPCTTTTSTTSSFEFVLPLNNVISNNCTSSSYNNNYNNSSSSSLYNNTKVKAEHKLLLCNGSLAINGNGTATTTTSSTDISPSGPGFVPLPLTFSKRKAGPPNNNGLKPTIVKSQQLLDNVEMTIKAVGSYVEPVEEAASTCSAGVAGESNSNSVTVMAGGGTDSSPALSNGTKDSSSSNSSPGGGSSSSTGNGTIETKSNASYCEKKHLPHIGSRHSAFLPYRPITILTNLQRGNVKTLNKEIITQPLTPHEKAARGDLTIEDLNGITNVDILDQKGRTMLMWASFHSRLPTVQMLIEKGSNVNCCTPKGDTALMFAASNGNAEVVNCLLSNGADIEMDDENGNTALFFSIVANHSPSITMLLKHGASMMKANCNGDTALNLAISKNLTAAQYAMESFLREYLETNFVINRENHL